MDGKNGRDAIMKYSKITLVLAAFAATACAIEVLPETPAENQPEVQLYPMTFTAGADDGSAPETKVTLDGKSVLWSANDQIKVFDGTATPLSAFTIANGAGKTSATFSGSVADPSAKTYYALYPYQSDATCTVSEITISSTKYSSYLTVDLPETQKAVDGSVDPDAFIAVAVSDASGNFSFKNLNSLVKFRLSESDVTNLESISISSNTLEAIAGSMNVAINASGIPVQTYVSGKMDSYVTLNAPEGGFKANTDYYFAIRSIGFASGLTITAKYTDGSCKNASSAKAPSKSLSRNSVLNLGSLTLANGLPNDLYIAYLHGQNIDAAGTMVNKSLFPSATLIKANGKTSSGVNFVNPSLTVTMETLSNQIIIGRFLDQKSTVTKGSVYYLSGTSGTDCLILKNLSLSLTTDKDYHFGSNADNTTFEKVGFDNCKITITKTLVKSTGTTRVIESFVMKDCDIKVTASSIKLFDSNNLNQTLQTVSFENNILYAESDVEKFYAFYGTGSTITSLKFNRNTVVNLYPAPAYAYNYAKDATSEGSNNLFYIPSYKTVVIGLVSGSSTDYEPKYTGIVRKGSYNEVQTNFKANYAIYTEAPSATDARLKCGHGTNANNPDGEIASVSKDQSANDGVMKYDSEHFDVVNGIFIPLVSTYGAQRTQTGTETLSERQTWTGVSAWE